ncbi:MAG: PAS domain-containing sensor histidine kinase [Colwellia sp.]|nr:PAS domain-containing sensor histidine kinase [Colwellia sp.]
MKYLTFLSLRSRFLIAPVIGIVLAILLYMASNAIIDEHSEVLEKLSESNLPLITSISQSSLLLGDEYTQLTLLLLSAQKHQDEEKIYIDGRNILNNLHDIEQEFIDGLEIENSGDTSKPQTDHFVKIKQAFLLYKNAVIGAIELSSVDVNRAQQELLLAGKVLQDLNRLLLTLSKIHIEKMTSASSLIESSLGQNNALSLVAVILISLMLFSALYFSRNLANSLGKINQALFSLAKGNYIKSLPEQNDKYMQKLSNAVSQFSSTLKENDRQAAELENKVALLTDSEKRIVALLDVTATAIIAINSSQEIVLFNKAAEQMFGFDNRNVMGEDVSLLIPKAYREQYVDMVNYFDTGTKEHKLSLNKEPLKALKKSGEIFPIEANISRLELASETINTISISDISYRIAAETALLKYQEELEDKVLKRTFELQCSVEDLQNTQGLLVESEKMALLGRLVAGIAHELNTPIGICVTATSYLEETIAKLITAYQSKNLSNQDFLNFVDKAPETIQMLLANLIRAADLISSFKLVSVDVSSEMPRQLNLYDYINEVITSLKPETKQYSHQIHVIGDSSLTVEVFPGPIYQVITNLVMNSMIHAFDGDKQGEIKIEIKSEKSTATINYSDNGIGIPSDNIPMIFEPFYTTKRNCGGSGLGMYLVYNLVTTSLKGKIYCRSDVGKGTHFTIDFPVKLTGD